MIPHSHKRAGSLARRDVLRLGLMSPLMAGIGSRLIGEARGAPMNRNVLITLVSGSAFPIRHKSLTQAKVDEFIAERLDRNPDTFQKSPGLEAKWRGYYDYFRDKGVLPDSLLAVRQSNDTEDPAIAEPLDGHTLTGPLGAFESRKDRLLYFSRLYATGGNEERGGWSHGGGMRVLTAHGTSKIPRNASIDQHIAEVIGAGTVERSIRFTVDRHSAASFRGKERDFQNFKHGHFASGNETSLPSYANPLLFFQDLFGAVEQQDPAEDVRNRLRSAVFDHLRGDIRTLQSSLASNERAKLDVLLGELDQFAMSQEARAQLSCESPGAPPTSLLESADGHAQATFMLELGALAVRCGLTNVLSVAIGAQPGSHEPMWAHGGYPMGHSVMHYGSCYQFWDDYMPALARVLDDFETVPNGAGRTLADDTTVMMMGDCGACFYGQHVGEMKPQWIGCGPDFQMAVLAPTGKMRGGHFFQYPSIKKLRGPLAESECTSQASVFRTVGEVLGAPGFEGHPICHARTMTECMV